MAPRRPSQPSGSLPPSGAAALGAARTPAPPLPPGSRANRVPKAGPAPGPGRFQRLLFEQSTMGLALCRMDGSLVDVNPAFAAILGRTVPETLALTYWDITPKDYADQEQAQLDSLRQTGRYGPYEKEYLHKDGTRVPVRLSGCILQREGETLLWSSVEDLSEIKRAEGELRRSEAIRAEILSRVSDAFVALDKDWHYTFLNEQAAALFGRKPEELIGKHIWTEFPEGVGQPFHQNYEKAMREQVPVFFEDHYAPWDRWFENRIFPSPGGISIFFHEITERKRNETLRAGQGRLLEMIATDAPLRETLTFLVQILEAQSPGMLYSVLLLDPDGGHLRHGAAPSLPDDFVRAIDGAAIGPTAGSCGTAAFRGEAVFVEDIAADPLWEDYRHLALPHGFRSCWSTPIFDGQRRVLGTFAVYGRQARQPGVEHIQLIEIGTHLAALAISRNLATEALGASEARFRAYIEQASDALFVHDFSGRFIDVNPQACASLGYSREELLRMSVFDVETEFDLAQAQAAWSQVRPDEPFTLLGNQRRKDGSRFPVEIRFGSFDLMGERRYMGLVRDVTERQRAEEALTQRATQLSALNALGTSLSSTLDLHARAHAALLGILAAVSPDLALLFLREDDGLRLLDSASRGGLHHAETPGHRLGHCLCGLGAKEGRPLYSLDIHADLRCTWDECKKAGVKSFAVLPLKSNDEVIGVLGLASATERDFQEQSAFLETMATQVATGIQNALLHQELKAHAADLERRVEERSALLREANEDLALAVQHAQTADRAKSAFLSAMSHELRTPLNSVIGFTGVLLGGLAGEIKPEQREPLAIVQRNGRHLLELINDVLDLSKIEANEMRLSPGPFDLAQVAREALDSIAPAASVKGLALARVLPKEPLSLPGDRRRTAQILLNLLSNAVKFTQAGTVTLSLSTGDGKALVAIRDTGPGIAEGDLPRLFREFEQLDVGLGRRNDGTGLGLALSRRLARLMDGDIVVASRPGQGSTFTLFLPLGVP